MCFWDAEDAALKNIDDVERKFFFRVKADSVDKVKALFGAVEEVCLDDVNEEVGMVTSVMKEKEFAALYAQASDSVVGNRIRLEA